jgi:hypothetical protein
METRLVAYLGLSVAEVVEKMGLARAKQFWVEEPPFTLRGRVYYLSDKHMSVTLYLNRHEPLHRAFSARGEWDHEAFLRSAVGGIQYTAPDLQVDVGDDVPGHWRRAPD